MSSMNQEARFLLKLGSACLLLAGGLIWLAGGIRPRAERPQPAKETAHADWSLWNEVADAYRQTGCTVRQTKDPTELFVTMSLSSASSLSGYQLKSLAQMSYKKLGENSRVYLYDTNGALLAKAWMWGASSEK